MYRIEEILSTCQHLSTQHPVGPIASTKLIQGIFSCGEVAEVDSVTKIPWKNWSIFQRDGCCAKDFFRKLRFCFRSFFLGDFGDIILLRSFGS